MKSGTPAPASCEAVADDLSLLLDGELPTWQATEVRAHLDGCERCARFYSSLRAQLTLHRWAADGAFAFDDTDACLPEDVPDFAALSARLEAADLGALGHALYAILKAEFLHVYGQGLAAQQAPITDPHAERRRGAEMVDELRDWHDADEVDGVDLRAVAERLAPGPADGLDQLVQGMEAVIRLAPALAHAARYYQAMAHVKARRGAEATRLLEAVAADGPAPLVRIARICLATLPALLDDDPAESQRRLESCLASDQGDAVVWFNLAKVHVQQGADAAARACIARARALDPVLVEAQLSGPSEGALRAALAG